MHSLGNGAAAALTLNVALLLAGVPAQSTLQESVPSFLEIDGVVAIEAEHYSGRQGPWQLVEGRNALATGYGIVPEYRLHPVPSPVVSDAPGALELPRQFPIGWGHVAGDGVPLLVTDNDRSRAAVFAYEKGARMHGLSAPARRVGLFSPRDGMPQDTWAWLDWAVSWGLAGAPRGRRALLLVGDPTLSAIDRPIVERLRGLGLDVRTAEHTATLEDGPRPDILVISESVHPDRVAGRFRDAAVPAVVMKTFVFEHMGMVETRPATWAGNAVMIAGGAWTDHLRYAIHFTQPGDYTLWLLGRDGGDAGSDEVKVFFDAEIDPKSDQFFEVRLPREPGWTNVAHVRRPENGKTPAPPLLRVTRAGWHTLNLVKGAEPESHTGDLPSSRRYPNWRVDKLAIFLDASRVPDGDGPGETRNPGTHTLPAAASRAPEPAGPRRAVRDGYLVVEAEDLQPHPAWELRHDPAGFTGRGYLEWRGTNRSRSVEGVGGTDDRWHTQQGPMEEWLIVRLTVPADGDYTVDIRNHHRQADGDNDAWIGLVERGFPRRLVKRVGDSLRDGPGFSWLDWGSPTLRLARGEHILYVGGRSRGFGVDRIAIYDAASAAARQRALDPATPASTPD